MSAISRRERDIFTCFADTVVAPDAAMAAIAETDAASAFAAWLEAAPPLQRNGLRALLHAVELAPLAVGLPGRLRQLDREQRATALSRLRRGPGKLAVDALAGLAHFTYYGDDAVMRAHGYDPDKVTARGRALRAAEARW